MTTTAPLSTIDKLEFFRFDALPEDKKALECKSCRKPCKVPQEIRPCQHIFCGQCINKAVLEMVGVACPYCYGPIESVDTPTRALVQMLAALPGKCRECNWTGTLEEFQDRHYKKHTQPPTTAWPASPEFHPQSTAYRASVFHPGEFHSQSAEYRASLFRPTDPTSGEFHPQSDAYRASLFPPTREFAFGDTAFAAEVFRLQSTAHLEASFDQM